MMQCTIGCICLKLLHFASSNSSSNWLPERRHIHIRSIYLVYSTVCFQMFIESVWIIWCKVALSAFVWLSPVCVYKCRNHWLHLFKFSPLCSVSSKPSSNRLPGRRLIHTGCIYSFLGHRVLSNVCSKRFYQRKQSCTGSICMTFLQCEFSNGSSKCLFVGMHITEGCYKAPTM